jgi:hypothetical protein
MVAGMPKLLLEPPSELHLRPGETSRIRLGGAGSAGYGWSWTIEGDAKCISVTLEAGPASTPVARGELHTTTRDQIIVVQAIHPGKATLHLKLARSFQPSRAPLAAYTVAITVPSG